jgi:acyl carrier protein
MSIPEQQTGEVLDEVAAMLRDVIGEEWIADVDIGMETSFVTDLEIESVEMVALAERVHERFGEGVDIAGWLSGLGIYELSELTVGDLVGHVARNL